MLCQRISILPIIPLSVVFWIGRKGKMPAKENLSLFLIPASCFILRAILYTETLTEYVTGTFSIFLATLSVFKFRKKAEIAGKGKIPGLVFYAYYPLHILVLLALNF